MNNMNDLQIVNITPTSTRTHSKISFVAFYQEYEQNAYSWAQIAILVPIFLSFCFFSKICMDSFRRSLHRHIRGMSICQTQIIIFIVFLNALYDVQYIDDQCVWTKNIFGTVKTVSPESAECTDTLV